ncbi:MAG: hypothetical protein MJ197_10705 [Bacteroidales bacterium]|nr:hypothetical protein [Bacteroidales bacterium]
MKKIRLNESQFNRLVAKCVKRVIKENEGIDTISFTDVPLSNQEANALKNKLARESYSLNRGGSIIIDNIEIIPNMDGCDIDINCEVNGTWDDAIWKLSQVCSDFVSERFGEDLNFIEFTC